MKMSCVLGKWYFPCLLLLLASCAATHTAISKRNLDVQNQMSDSIFLTPTSPDKKTVFVDIKNTSDKQQLIISPKIIEAVSQKGYRIVEDPNEANYILQANILKVGNMDLREAESFLNKGYGAGLEGIAAGGTIGVLTGGDTSSGLLGGLLGGGAAIVGNALVKDVSYSIITDIQLSEKTDVSVKQHTQSNLKQGNSGNVTVEASEETNWKRYQTRIVSTANKVNLKFDEAVPGLISGLSMAISGLL